MTEDLLVEVVMSGQVMIVVLIVSLVRSVRDDGSGDGHLRVGHGGCNGGRKCQVRLCWWF